jgi:glucose-fructose oxidoreductase
MSKEGNRIRYAVVGLGHIAQVAVLPAFAHAGKNSVLAAIVSDNRRKRDEISRKYGVAEAYGYDEYDRCLKEVDAVYIALPNSLHAEYSIRAARAGVHVLCEKPMAVTVAECRSMIDACRRNRTKLMIAYRLHFEEINLKAIDLVRSGRIGEPRFFNSSFAMTVRAGNIRTKADLGGGTLYDIGIYCINAARYLFGSEPVEVLATSVHTGSRKFQEIDETTGGLLRFERNRLAAFVASFNAADVASYRIVGTRGDIQVHAAYEYAEELSYELTINGKTSRKKVPRRDQFAPELLYFSDCIQRDRRPEPSGEEGMQDVRIIQALYESAHARRAIRIARIPRERRPTSLQLIRRPGISKPRLVNVVSASQD